MKERYLLVLVGGIG